MGKRYLIDSNVLIDFLEQSLPVGGHSFVANIIDEQFNISVINRIELLGYKDASEETRNFIALATIYELNTMVAEATIAIRKKKKIKVPDAIIAATAQVNGLIVVTHNKKDFEHIKGVVCVDPYALNTQP